MSVQANKVHFRSTPTWTTVLQNGKKYKKQVEEKDCQ